MKLLLIGLMLIMSLVAPHVGAWIETKLTVRNDSGVAVAPHVGAWIETTSLSTYISLDGVAPHVGAWIETAPFAPGTSRGLVAPHVGAWIETPLPPNRLYPRIRRTPRGCVD